MIAVGRHINGITLNDLEYLLDADGNEMLFRDVHEAYEFLEKSGCSQEEIYYMVFEKRSDG